MKLKLSITATLINTPIIITNIYAFQCKCRTPKFCKPVVEKINKIFNIAMDTAFIFNVAI